MRQLGEFGRLSFRRSAYTRYVELNPTIKRGLIAALCLCVVLLARRANGRAPARA